MRHTPIREVEQKRRVGSGTLFVGLTIFVMALTMLTGNVKLYELRQESQELKKTLEERQEELAELKREIADLPDLDARARALGLREVDPAEVEVLHIRGQ